MASGPAFVVRNFGTVYKGCYTCPAQM